MCKRLFPLGAAWLSVVLVFTAQSNSQESTVTPETRLEIHPSKVPAALAGKWLLTMPAGFEFDATIEPDDRPNYFVLKAKGAPNVLGVYELKGTRLVMNTPRVSKMLGLEWVILNNNTIVLVEHPKDSQFGSDYRGATLGRQRIADPEPEGE